MMQGADALPREVAVWMSSRNAALLEEVAHKLTPRRRSVIEDCQRQVTDILLPLAAVPRPGEGSGAATPVHNRGLVAAAQERTPLSTDRRRLGDTTTKPLYSKERRGGKRRRAGFDSEASGGATELEDNAEEEFRPAGGLLPAARTRKQRKKRGLHVGD
jgi:hypothetical protein